MLPCCRQRLRAAPGCAAAGQQCSAARELLSAQLLCGKQAAHVLLLLLLLLLVVLLLRSVGCSSLHGEAGCRLGIAAEYYCAAAGPEMSPTSPAWASTSSKRQPSRTC